MSCTPKASPHQGSKAAQPHDLFFKKVMNNRLVAQEFIEAHLPAAIRNKIDPESLQLTDGSFVGENFTEKRTDILYRATFCGAPGYIYCIIEHQSAPDRLMPLRMFEYVLEVIRRDLKKEGSSQFFPIVYPCVIYNGKKPYCYTTDIFQMFEDPGLAKEIFLQPFHLVDLSTTPDEELKKRPLLGFMEMLLKHARTRESLLLIKNIADLLKQLESMNQLDLIGDGAYYIFQTNRDEKISRYEILHEFKKYLTPLAQKNIMTSAQAFVEEGRKEGRQEGRKEGASFLFAQLLKRRFGNEAVEKYLLLLEKADREQLARWSDHIFDAQKIEDVFVAA